ncbi:hypothetical protein NP493_484g00036 [Ridgeia piscesae]|uniref:Cleavage stimulation factor subunit 2 n=1 Tax=Ridgeia piscesae TaxID=27915 RepID=A0AAD9NU47_RIDPI|nr:hypothetical protein NP493_484g00036 [Ridgeia piscesae]
MQQAVGGPILESPYGEAVEPSKAPEAISKAVASLPPEQMFELMKQMKMCIQNNPNEARNMLLQNPQLAYALLQAQIVMKIVDPQAMLHRETEQIPPLLPASSATSEPSHNAPPAMQTAASHAGTGMTPASMPLSQPMSVAGGHMGNPMQGISMQGGSQLPGLDYRRDVDMPMAARSSLLGDHPQHSGQPGSMGQQHMDMHMGGNRGPPFMEGRGPRGPTPQQDMGSMHDMGPSRGPVSRTDMGPMHGMGGPRGPGPRSDMGQMHEMGMPRGPVPRPDMGPMRDMGGPRGPHPRAVRPDQPDPRGVSVGGDRGRAPPPRQAAPQVGAAAALPPGGIPGLSGSTSISPQDHEKAALIMQVLQLSDDQIAMLPPDQRQSILILKEQIARSGQAPS